MQDLIRRLDGVISTRVGYTGGDVPNATYRNHGTHAEAIEIIFDPIKISYRRLLEFFFQIHDPTTKNRQGNDVGLSYRSAIFYTSDEQKRIAEATIAANSFAGFQWRLAAALASKLPLESTDKEASMPELDPSHIMQVGMGFFASKTLLSAVELGLFTELAKQPMTGAEIVRTLGLNPRAVPDFPDALVALKFLARAGDGPDARYSNTPESAMFLDRQSAGYIGGILEMANARLYRFWADLTEALKTGAPQNETKNSGEPMFAKLYETPERLEQFMNAMSGVSAGNFKTFSQKFDFAKYKTLCDVGGATGQLSCMVAAANPHMSCISFDLPKVAPIATRKIEQAGSGRPRRGRRRRLLRRSIAQGGRHHDGDDLARLEP